MVVTMKDVAERAGVSKSTVSQYLNKRYNYMSEETRVRIETAIAELGYEPNQLARSLKQKRTNIIAIVAATLSSKFTTDLISTVEGIMAKNGIDVIVASTSDDYKKERKQVTSLIARQVDGIIVFPTIENESFYQRLIEKGYPIIFVDRELPKLHVNTVLLDNEKASEMAVDEFVSKGHQEIAILTLPLGKEGSITTRKERISGYQKALKKNGIEPDPALVKVSVSEQTAENMSALMSLPTPPTAVIASNDLLLEKILLWVKENKISIPDRLSIIAIDDVSFAQFYPVGITTISQPIEKIGSKAAELLLAQINQPKKVAVSTIRYSPTLNIRESVAEIC